MEKTECTWYFSEIYCWNVSSNKASIYSLTSTTKLRRSRSAVFSEEFLTLSTTAEQLEFIRRKLKVEREIVCQISSLTVGQRNNQALLAFGEERVFDCKLFWHALSSMLRGVPFPLLSVSSGNVTFHVSKLWQGGINKKKGGLWKFLSIFFFYYAVPENIYTHHKGDLWALNSHFF